MDIRTHETVRLRPPSPGHSSEKRSLAEDEFPTRNCLLSPAPTSRKQATRCGLSGMHCQLGHHSFAFSNQAAHEDTMNRPGEEPEETVGQARSAQRLQSSSLYGCPRRLLPLQSSRSGASLLCTVPQPGQFACCVFMAQGQHSSLFRPSRTERCSVFCTQEAPTPSGLGDGSFRAEGAAAS